ncbi:MAG: glycosyltransferase family 2 protein [Oscillospiraceae bacterium]|nr:glycosyltransferase family 2 protein [Oscillospiraceae bacterium]
MAEISLCMIVKDEEELLGRCLDSVKALVDEIIIVDTGSKDKTKQIAANYTDKIYDFEWIYDFAAARNFSFSKATAQYQMWLDADDIVAASEHEKFLNLKEDLSKGDVDMAMLRYNVNFDNEDRPITSYFRERLFKREMNYRWGGAIHEGITPRGKVKNFDISIEHRKLKPGDPFRNIDIFERLLDKGSLSARDKFYYARELMFHHRLEEAAEWFRAFLEEKHGWNEDKIQACLDLYECYPNDEQKAVTSVLNAFYYDRPRAEGCCKMGHFFANKGEYKAAAFWYESALTSNISERKGFVLNDCYDFIPYIELCVCYDRLGEREKALYYHKKSKELKPRDKSVIFNDKYFSNS